jgi:hypothetical protein
MVWSKTEDMGIEEVFRLLFILFIVALFLVCLSVAMILPYLEVIK